MTPPALGAIEGEVRSMAARIGAGADLLPTFGRTHDGARPHVEVNDAGLHWVVVERGAELERATYQDVGALLERVFRSVTFAMAVTWELRHRRVGQDSRRLMFARQLELLRTLSPAWAEREMEAQAATLARHPYDDASEERVRLTTRLRQAGQSEAEAWRNACARLPLPEADTDRR